MNKTSIIEVGIKLIGIHALVTALTDGLSNLHQAIADWSLVGDGLFGRSYYAGNVIAYLLIPLLVFVTAVLFGRKIARKITIDSPNEKIEIERSNLLKVGLRILGLYILIFNGAGALSYLFELFAIEAGNLNYESLRVKADLVYHAVAMLSGIYILMRTNKIIGIMEIEPNSAGNVG